MNDDGALLEKRDALFQATDSDEGEQDAIKLIREGVDPTVSDDIGRSLIHYAAVRGHKGLINVLLECGCDLNQADQHGVTPLLYVANSQKSEKIAMFLLEQGADPFVTGHQGQTALLLAAARGQHKVILALLDKGVPIDQATLDGYTPLMAAAARKHESAALLLLDHGADPHCTNRYGCTNQYKATALLPACFNKQMQLVKRLVACGLDVNQTFAFGHTPLTIVAREEDGEEIALYLLENGADPLIVDEDGISALDCAGIMGHIALIDALLDKGVDINRASNNGNTPLMWAASSQRGETAALHLLDRGADPLATSDDESTALLMAASRGHTKLAAKLLNASKKC